MSKNINKVLVFVINLLLMAVAFLVIKNRDRERLASNVDQNSETVPVPGEVVSSQEQITTDRENKLRELNTTPTESRTTITTTTTKTTVPAPSTSTKTS